MARALMIVLPIVLAIYALVDCIQTEDDNVRHLPKWAWIVLIVLIGIVGPVTWLIAGRRRGPGRPRVRPSNAGPLAPDDDPEFLHRLDDDVKRKRRTNSDDPDEKPTS